MPSLILPCANCKTSTIHRSAASEPAGGGPAGGGGEQFVRCDACGTTISVPADESGGDFTIDAVRLLSMLPALSKKSAHGKLEELLYEHRAGIEASDAFCDALVPTNAADVEMQDIKVKTYRSEQAGVVVDFTYYALGERDEEQSHRRFRVDGTGTGRIDNDGSTEIHDVTAAVSDY